MPGEPILIIDDTPVNLKLTRILLVNEGYEVRTAPDAEEALAILENFRPALMLVDIQLPGMDGLELTRRVKASPRLRDVVVVALTAFAMKGDEQRARDAGCDGYITKPIDTRVLPVRIREFLSRNGNSPSPSDAKPATADPLDAAAPEVESLRRRFLAESLTQSRDILDSLGAGFSASDVSKRMHQWVGAAGLLGYREISDAARELEQVLREPPLDNAQVREMLIDLMFAFSDPPEIAPRPAPPSIAEKLAGRRIAIIGSAGAHTERIRKAFAGVHAIPVTFPPDQRPDSAEIATCDLVIVQAGAETLTTDWLSPDPRADCGKPQMLAGDRETLMGLDDAVRGRSRDFLMDAWLPGEALVRAARALTARIDVRSRRSYVPAGARAKVLLAGMDPAVVSPVRAALQNCGIEAESAGGGMEALDRIRRQEPDAVVLDVEVNGNELLAGIRSAGIAAAVVLLAGPHQEADVVRGLNLGANDYLAKPFSRLELAARLRRLLQL